MGGLCQVRLSVTCGCGSTKGWESSVSHHHALHFVYLPTAVLSHSP